MTRLEDGRRFEIAKYYHAHRQHTYDMKPWRQAILTDWLKAMNGVGCGSYLDVGCGKAESLQLALEIDMASRGCEVVDYLCKEWNIDHIEGAHDLPYVNEQFDIVSCNNVMEHIMEEDVPSVLREISRVTSRAVLLGISRNPAPDDPDELLHITIKSEEWWMDQIVKNIKGRATIVFVDRIKPIEKPYLWVSIQ